MHKVNEQHQCGDKEITTKQKVFAALAIITVAGIILTNESKAASALPTITPTTALQFNPVTQLQNQNQQNLRTNIATMTNQINNAASVLGVTQNSQVQWTGQAVGGATSNIATDLGNVFLAADRASNTASPAVNLISFDSQSWQLTGNAPTITAGYTPAQINGAVNTLANNISLQTTSVITGMANTITGLASNYNQAYVLNGASVSAAALPVAQADYTTITGYVQNTRDAVGAARSFTVASAGIPTNFNNVSGWWNTFQTGATAPTWTAGVGSTPGHYTIGDRQYQSYADYVADNEGVAGVTSVATPGKSFGPNSPSTVSNLLQLSSTLGANGIATTTPTLIGSGTAYSTQVVNISGSTTPIALSNGQMAIQLLGGNGSQVVSTVAATALTNAAGVQYFVYQTAPNVWNAVKVSANVALHGSGLGGVFQPGTAETANLPSLRIAPWFQTNVNSAANFNPTGAMAIYQAGTFSALSELVGLDQ